MRVLSLFDGMSCGQIALNRANIPYEGYFSSEIKKHAIQTTQLHYPKTIQLGDIRNIKLSELPHIDLLIGGSPCQDLSLGNKKRSGLNGQKSSLFYEWERVFNYVKPDYFLLENVMMPIEDCKKITDSMGVGPVRINSSLVSAQTRDRLYWTNIGGVRNDLFGGFYGNISEPPNKNILLKDVLENGFCDRDKARALNTHNGASEKNKEGMWKRYTTTGMVTVVFDSPDLDWTKGIRFFTQKELERLQTIPEGYTSHLTKPKAHDLIGDGWTIDVITHIFSFIK